MPNWWGTKQKVGARLRLEVDVMRHAYPEFELLVPDSGQLSWRGTVEINLTGIPEREHTLELFYPDNYSASPPRVYVIEPEIKSKIYQHKDGRLSLYNPKDGPEFGWNPATSTAVTITSWAIQWLYAYYSSLQLGYWPDPTGEAK
jgi:hypothetical protein